MWAAYKGHSQVVTMLLEKGADVTASDNVSIIINYTPIVIVHVYPFEWVDQSNRRCCISHTVCVHVHV